MMDKDAARVLINEAIEYILEYGDKVEQLQVIAILLQIQARLMEKVKDEFERTKYNEVMQQSINPAVDWQQLAQKQMYAGIANAQSARGKPSE